VSRAAFGSSPAEDTLDVRDADQDEQAEQQHEADGVDLGLLLVVLCVV
jgi:hypothetical protein